MIEWYIGNALQLRAVSYFVIMVFFIVWGAWAAGHKLYHRAMIKIGTALMLMSFVIYAVSPDPRVSLYLTTPVLVALAIVVIAFLARIRFWSTP